MDGGEKINCGSVITDVCARMVVFGVVVLRENDLIGSSFVKGVMEMTLSLVCNGVSLMISNSLMALISASIALLAINA